jgi:hypothetical protein
MSAWQPCGKRLRACIDDVCRSMGECAWPPREAVTAMCECSHHWNVHYESDKRTGDPAACRGSLGNATPGPYRPCGCRGFAQWSGPRDARTGEPVRPIQLATEG